MLLKYTMLIMPICYNSRSFGHFATGICAIIGGIFTVAGLIDSTIYKSAKVLKKLEIGKQGWGRGIMGR